MKTPVHDAMLAALKATVGHIGVVKCGRYEEQQAVRDQVDAAIKLAEAPEPLDEKPLPYTLSTLRWDKTQNVWHADLPTHTKHAGGRISIRRCTFNTSPWAVSFNTRNESKLIGRYASLEDAKHYAERWAFQP